jgi:hypothetical protein
MLPTNFRFTWSSGFRGDFFKSANQKQEWPVAAMFVNGSGQNEQSLYNTNSTQETDWNLTFPKLMSILSYLENINYIAISEFTSYIVSIYFSSPCQRQCELLPSLGVHRLSVNFSHFNLLL